MCSPIVQQLIYSECILYCPQSDAARIRRSTGACARAIRLYLCQLLGI
jgi:hypothetical protein